MKIEFKKSDFLKAFILGGSFAGKSRVLPILDNVKCMLKENGVLRFISSDGEQAISTKFDGTIMLSESCNFLLPYKEVVNYVKLINDASFYIIIEEDKCTIKHSKGKYNITLADAKDFPEISKINNNLAIDIDSNDLYYAISNSAPFLVDDSLRPIFGTIHLCIKDGMFEFCAASNITLTVFRVGDAEKNNVDFEMLINKNVIPVLLNNLKMGECCNIKVGDTNTVYTIGDTIIVARNTVGKFPNYNAVIPRDNPLRVKINKKDITESFSRCSLSSPNDMVRLSFSENKLIVSSENFNFGKSAKEELDINCNFNLNIAFNAKKFIDCMNIFEGEEILLSLADETRACVLSQEGCESISVLTPMMLI
ncbi:DNA polymerase III subunit beta [uncultured Bacteroides sp.]|uniref:DNA polymerase III subunit beta n=1 Tax=uncultured Bacteroides sp. TaxID=162156 RepID=UPI00262E7E57|nr:DNA polymerase III subunit beta [uncultured Bacteroides sp.]